MLLILKVLELVLLPEKGLLQLLPLLPQARLAIFEASVLLLEVFERAF